MTDDELKRLFDETRREFRETADRIAKDTRQQIDIVAEHFDETADRIAQDSRHQIETFVERIDRRFDLLTESIAAVDEKLDRKTADIEERMERGFADTQAMIKFSHSELDRRVRSLEQDVADLQSRVERLESSTH